MVTFNTPSGVKDYVKGVHNFFENEAYKQQRDCNVKEIDKFMGNAMNRDYYQYRYSDKLYVEEKKKEEGDGEKSENKEVRRENNKRKKTMEAGEAERLKQEEETKKLALVNIKEVKQGNPNTFVKEALQKDFEEGFNAMFKFLHSKLPNKFPDVADAHKMFVNLLKMPNGRTIPQVEFFLGQLHKFIEEMKVMCYEMKLNGLSRILIPIQANEEFIKLLKRIYDIHNVIDRLLGDKLLLEQYLFIYDCIKFIVDSNMKEELEIYKQKDLMENRIPKYVFYMSMVHSAKILNKFKEASRRDGGHYEIEQYYQPLKKEINSPYNLPLNAYEQSSTQTLSEAFKEMEKIFWDEVEEFGRFWLMEGYFEAEKRDRWLEAIEILADVNILVHENIRDMILTNSEESMRKNKQKGKNLAKEPQQNLNRLSIGTEVSASESSQNVNNAEVKKSYRGSVSKGKVNSSKKFPIIRKNTSKKSGFKVSTDRKSSLDSIDQLIIRIVRNDFFCFAMITMQLFCQYFFDIPLSNMISSFQACFAIIAAYYTVF